MNILLAADGNPVEEGGGGHRVLNEHARYLALRGHQVSVLFRKPNPDTPTPAEWQGCRLYPYDVDMSSTLRIVRSTLANAPAALDRVRREGTPDVACIHGPFTGLALGRKREFPLVYDFHSPGPAEYLSRLEGRPEATRGILGRLVHRLAIPQTMRLIEGLVLKRCTRVFCESASMRAELRRWHPRALATEPRIIPGGVDVERFRPLEDIDAARRRLGLPADRKIIFALRWLVPRVGMANFLDAVAELRRVRSDFLCVIGGKGPLREALEEQAARLGIAEHVRFLGFVPEEDLAELYGSADLFVQPDTHLQGFGLPILEALAAGTPLLATAVGGATEILEGFRNGELMFTDESPPTMGRQMGVALDWGADSGRRTEARRYAVETYSWERIVDQLQGYLKEAVQAHG